MSGYSTYCILCGAVISSPARWMTDFLEEEQEWMYNFYARE